MTIKFIPARERPPSPPDGSHFDAISFVAMDPTLLILAYFLLINALTWFLFWIDKRRAIQDEWRVSENTLLLLAMLGGTIGAFAARKVFRHKTRKQPFVAHLFGIALFQMVFVVYFLLGKHV